MKTTNLKNILVALFLMSFIGNASAEWILNDTVSTINTISTKKLKIGEVHSFKSFEGSLKDNGNILLTVKLNSIETNIPIRNDRMQQFLFEVIQFPTANASATIAIADINKLKVGESFSKNIAFDISIHGHQQTLGIDMQITLLAENKLLVSTIKPIILDLGQFSLIKGIEKLKELAKLPSISTAVPVTANFIFEKTKNK